MADENEKTNTDKFRWKKGDFIVTTGKPKKKGILARRKEAEKQAKEEKKSKDDKES
jgi:hypothetical protein